MSEERDESDKHEGDEHEGGIRTPKQLITVIAAAFIVPIIVIVLLVQFVTLSNKHSPGTEALASAAVAARIAPIASETVHDASIPQPAKTGQQVFEAQCTTCHTAGLLGAPKFGDAAAWGPRIGKGYDALLQSALHGKGSMPAQGGGDFTDYEIGRAVVYMADKGGAKFAEPAEPVASGASAPASGAAGAGAASGVASAGAASPSAVAPASAPSAASGAST